MLGLPPFEEVTDTAAGCDGGTNRKRHRAARPLYFQMLLNLSQPSN